MRRVGTAFAALSVLAVAVFAAGTLALNAVRDSARLSGEVLTGERSAAQGVTLYGRDRHALENGEYMDARLLLHPRH